MSSKANQILKNLNSQIQHTNNTGSISQKPQLQNKQVNPTIVIQNQYQPLLNQQSSLIAPLINQPQNQLKTQIPKSKIFDNQLRYEQTRQCPQFLTQMLHKQIGSLLSNIITENIQSVLKQRQKNTYDAFTKQPSSSCDHQYIKILYDQSKSKGLTNKNSQLQISAIESMLSKRYNKVQNDLQKGQVVINHQRNINTKKQLQYLHQGDLQRMIKIKDGQLRSKLDILNDKLQKFQQYDNHNQAQKNVFAQLQNKIDQMKDNDNYNLDSEKTKIAKDYIRYIHQQKRILQRKKNQRLKKYQQLQKQRDFQLKQAQQMKDLAKKQEILNRIQIRRKKRQQQQKEEQLKQQQVKKLLDEHHKKLPIFKIKQKQYEQRIVKPERKLYQQKLNQIRDYKKSMSMHQIKNHQNKYINKLQVDKKNREEEFKMIMKSRRNQDIMNKYYKGKAHKRIDQLTKETKLRNHSMRQASKVKAKRMSDYNQVIINLHKPKIDQDKKKQLQKLIQIDMMKKKHIKKIFKQVIDQHSKQVKFIQQYEEIPQKNHYEQGNKFLEYAKQHIKKKEKLTNQEKIQQLQGNKPRSRHSGLKLLSSTDQHKKQKDVWQLRAKQLQQFAKSQVVDAKVFQYIKANIQNLDNKAAQKQQTLKRMNLSMQQHMTEKGKLDHFYLSSIKQKIKLLQ